MSDENKQPDNHTCDNPECGCKRVVNTYNEMMEEIQPIIDKYEATLDQEDKIHLSVMLCSHLSKSIRERTGFPMPPLGPAGIVDIKMIPLGSAPTPQGLIEALMQTLMGGPPPSGETENQEEKPEPEAPKEQGNPFSFGFMRNMQPQEPPSPPN